MTATPNGHQPSAPTTQPRLKQIAFGVLMVVLLAIIAEIGSYVVIRVSRPYLDGEIRTTGSIYREQTAQLRRLLEQDSTRRDRFDAELGWHYRPGYVAPNEHINAAGLRGDRSYLPRAPDSVLRVAAFGDSFVFGMEVGFQDSWAWQLEQRDRRLEVLNYGVGGYGTDQALLRYRAEGTTYDPEIVLIGFVPVNLRRNVNRYRRFLSTREAAWVKPRFLLAASGELELLPSPIRSLDDWRPYLERPKMVRAFGVHDQWYQRLVYENPLHDWSATVRLVSNVYLRLKGRYFGPDRLVDGGQFRTNAPAYDLTVALLEQFASEVRRNGAQPIIVIFPDLRSVKASREGDNPVYAPLTRDLKEQHEVWDLAVPFVQAPPSLPVEDWFMPAGHYSPSANKIIADWMGRQLAERYPEHGS